MSEFQSIYVSLKREIFLPRQQGDGDQRIPVDLHIPSSSAKKICL